MRTTSLALVLALLAGCASIAPPAERHNLARSLAAGQGWQATTIKAGQFDLTSFAPPASAQIPELTIYIEGDGFAWISGTQPSADPTPRDPLALRLALAQPKGTAAYLARPCQFADAEATGCNSRYWTEARFAPEVITAMGQGIDHLKQQFGAAKIALVGYSGGGAIAALIAARRQDVSRLVTVAGNLDHQAWTDLHGINPLGGSLNPAEVTDDLRRIPQWHFVGGKDSNITPSLVNGFADRFPAQTRPIVRVIPSFDHRCCWVENWPMLWSRVGGSAPSN